MGYQQIPGVKWIERKKRSIRTKLDVFFVMPFGLCSASATIQGLKFGIFRNQIGKDLADYIDCLIRYVLRYVEMLKILDRTLGPLIDAGLKCKPRKCQVFRIRFPTWDA